MRWNGQFSMLYVSSDFRAKHSSMQQEDVDDRQTKIGVEHARLLVNIADVVLRGFVLFTEEALALLIEQV